MGIPWFPALRHVESLPPRALEVVLTFDRGTIEVFSAIGEHRTSSLLRQYVHAVSGRLDGLISQGLLLNGALGPFARRSQLAVDLDAVPSVR